MKSLNELETILTDAFLNCDNVTRSLISSVAKDIMEALKAQAAQSESADVEFDEAAAIHAAIPIRKCQMCFSEVTFIKGARWQFNANRSR